MSTSATASGPASAISRVVLQPYPKMIRNIWAVGRNYAPHAKELGNAIPSTEGEPIIFLKAGTCAVPSSELGGTGFPLPGFSDDIHHEAEIALEFGSDLEYCAMGFALDLTAREVQSRLKDNSCRGPSPNLS